MQILHGKKILISLMLIASTLCVYTYFTEIKSSPTGQDQQLYITKDTLVEQNIFYTQCKHLISEKNYANKEFQEKSFTQLRNEGWDIFWGDAGVAIASKNENGLCPNDQNRRHLALDNGRLAVFAGPSHSDGTLIEVLGILPESLPESWLEKINNQELDFATEEELFAALENLDEYN